MIWTPEMRERVARETPAVPPRVTGEVAGTTVEPTERLGPRGRGGTRFAPKGLLPAPPPEAPIGVLPTLGGPVTAPMWGRPILQPRPGFEPAGPVELMGPWGGTVEKPMVPPTVKPTEKPVIREPEPEPKVKPMKKPAPKKKTKKSEQTETE